MKQTMLVKLQPSESQAASLLHTMERFNAACDAIAVTALREKTASKVALQKFVYHDIRDAFGLSSQLTIRAIAKTCEAYKRDKSIQPTFKSHGAVVYDERVMSWKDVDRVSLLALDGRVIVPVRFGAYAEARCERMRGQADLLYRDGTFYLACTVDAPEADPIEPEGWMGVDLGIVQIATSSDSAAFLGAQLNGLRIRHERLRKHLQAKGTQSAKRLLKKRSRKQSRFQRCENHRIAKSLVAVAQDTRRGIALEELGGITGRVTVKRSQRSRHGNWGFFQLRQFVTYKAAVAGVSMVFVNPRDASRACPCCGCISTHNRPSQSSFVCTRRGYSVPADHNAACNIARRAAFNLPYAEGDFCPLAAIPRLSPWGS